MYFYKDQPALAILLQQPAVRDEMKVDCSGQDVSCALRLAYERMIYIRIVSQVSQRFTYHGVWLITGITQQSAESAQVDMMSMPDLP